MLKEISSGIYQYQSDMAIADSNEAKKESFSIEAKRGILTIHRDPIIQSSLVDFFNDETNLKELKELFSGE